MWGWMSTSGVMTRSFSSGCLPLCRRVLHAPHVPPRPSVKASGLNMRDVIGNKVVAESIALIHRCPQLSAGGMDGDSHRIANARRKDLLAASIGTELQNVRAIFLGGMHVRSRRRSSAILPRRTWFCRRARTRYRASSDRRLEQSAARKVADFLRRASRLQLSVAIREAHHRIGVADVNPLRLRPRWIESNAERLVKSGGELSHSAPRSPLESTPRRTLMIPGSLSARKTSPLGAARSSRGFCNLSA